MNLPEQFSSGSRASPSFVVGIGASAGGLESLEKLFQNLPADTGMAFVIIQHLSPDFKSMMYELLARDTKMDIHRAEDGMQLEANNVYLLPPKKEIIIAGGELHLIDKDLSKGLTLPIDRFFESLARECGPRGIAIILSGSGSDGSRGIRDLSQAGALVICESETTAKFDGMPLSAQATGLVDMVLSPQEMGKALIQHAANPPPGSPIDVTMKAKDGMAMVTVRDEGSGIPADFLPKIFEPFVQSDETLDRSEGGLGVGLTLVRSLVELHRGSIEAFSEGRDSGSTFLLKIPLTELRPSAREPSKSASTCRLPKDGRSQTKLNSKRIVLVEDIDDNREMLQSILELDGHEVVSAMDGEAGCDAIRSFKPDIALIDIGLPGIDGYEVARKVRLDSSCEKVRLVALTGYGQSSDIANARAAGFDAHLVKPVDPTALAKIIEWHGPHAVD